MVAQFDGGEIVGANDAYPEEDIISYWEIKAYGACARGLINQCLSSEKGKCRFGLPNIWAVFDVLHTQF